MESSSNFLINLSILYRNTQKYFDKVLAQYDIGSGQLVFLFSIYENEGITMQEVTRIGELDKGTTTKSIQKLIEQGYVLTKTDESDRRVKRLYTTAKAAGIMNALYEYRNECRNRLASGIDFDGFEKMLDQACINSRKYLAPEEQYQGIKIGGLQKMTLLDYPGLVAATVFTSGCSFKCPYCHNKDLVFVPENFTYFDVQEVLDYFEKRKGILDGICITGGEPLLQEGLLDFLRTIKNMGYQVKVDTNGNEPERLKELISSHVVDYVAMDIKNSFDKYCTTVGLNQDVFDISKIQESAQYLMTCGIDYEFRTTVVKELHTKEDLMQIGEWLKGAKHYYLQQFEDGSGVIQKGYSAYSASEMQELCDMMKTYIPNTKLRGIREE